MGKLLLLFILVPLLDAWLLFQVAEVLGFLGTFALVIATGTLGAWLFRLEGSRTWATWQAALAQGRMPEEGVLGGVMLLLGGALLVTPGVITDFVGLMLLLPPTRRLIAAAARPRLTQYVKDKAQSVVDSPNVQVVHFGFGGGGHGHAPPERGDTEVVGRRIPIGSGLPGMTERRGRRPEVIEADFEVKPD